MLQVTSWRCSGLLALRRAGGTWDFWGGIADIFVFFVGFCLQNPWTHHAKGKSFQIFPYARWQKRVYSKATKISILALLECSLHGNSTSLWSVQFSSYVDGQVFKRFCGMESPSHLWKVCLGRGSKRPFQQRGNELKPDATPLGTEIRSVIIGMLSSITMTHCWEGTFYMQD